MIGQHFDIDAQLVISLNNDNFVLVAEGNYLIVNFQDIKALERVAKTAGELGENFAAPEPDTGRTESGGGPLKKLNDLNQKILEMGLVIEVRVNNKTYVEFGAGNSARIKAAAIFGKIGSFFSRS
ncbi:MAG TPA: hypothetical protein VK927_09810 [Adhaeribacter sp.]|nr:hypothetical protein [Adhaeribacter sp.]